MKQQKKEDFTYTLKVIWLIIGFVGFLIIEFANVNKTHGIGMIYYLLAVIISYLLELNLHHRK